MCFTVQVPLVVQYMVELVGTPAMVKKAFWVGILTCQVESYHQFYVTWFGSVEDSLQKYGRDPII